MCAAEQGHYCGLGRLAYRMPPQLEMVCVFRTVGSLNSMLQMEEENDKNDEVDAFFCSIHTGTGITARSASKIAKKNPKELKTIVVFSADEKKVMLSCGPKRARWYLCCAEAGQVTELIVGNFCCILKH